MKPSSLVSRAKYASRNLTSVLRLGKLAMLTAESVRLALHEFAAIGPAVSAATACPKKISASGKVAGCILYARRDAKM